MTGRSIAFWTIAATMAVFITWFALPQVGHTDMPAAANPSADKRAAGPDRFSTDPSIDWTQLSDDYWRQNLTKAEYGVCRQGGTERPWSGQYNDYKKDGVFHCSSCGAPLYSSSTKFDSGTGWPSFWDTVDPDAVERRTDSTFGMKRTEVLCKRCGAHLGHVFNDGPRPTGERHCINSVCLLHRPSEEETAKP